MNGRQDAERIENMMSEWDEDGFHLSVLTDEEDYEFRITDTDTARKVLSAVSKLRSWIEEEQRQKAAYDAASPEERARVLGREGDEE